MGKGAIHLNMRVPRRHWLDGVMFVIRAVWGISGMWYLHQEQVPPLLFELGAFGYVLSFTLPMALHRSPKAPRWAAPAAELTVTGILFLLAGGGQEHLFPFFQVPFLTLGYLCAGRQLAWAGPAALALPIMLAGGLPEVSRGEAVDALANWLVLLVIGFCFRKLVDSYQQIRRMYGIIRKQNATLELYARQIEELTLAEERGRLSRELHDTVGHTFTASIVGLDAVYYLMDHDPVEAKNSLRELLAHMRSGLDEVRRHIHAIAPEREECRLSLTLRRIAGEFEMHTGMKVPLAVEGGEYLLPDGIRLTLIRCLQEALTNAKRHGMAQEARITLAFRQSEVVMTTEDNGTGTDQPVKGFGLQSMSDRLAGLNGTLELSSSPGMGMKLVCTVPATRPEGGTMMEEGA